MYQNIIQLNGQQILPCLYQVPEYHHAQIFQCSFSSNIRGERIFLKLIIFRLLKEFPILCNPKDQFSVTEKIHWTLPKGTFHPRRGHEGQRREQTQSSHLALTSALDGSGWSLPRLGRVTHRKDPVPTVQEAGWAPWSVWTGAENLATTGIRSPDRPARSESYTGYAIPTLP